MRLVTLIAALILISDPAGAGDWSGSYVAGQIDGANPVSESTSVANDGLARYGPDFIRSKLVLGAQIEVGRFDLRRSPSGVDLGDAGRLNLRTNRDFEPGPAYTIVGGTNGEITQTHETGVVYGLGLSMPIGDQLSHIGEELRLVFGEFSGNGHDQQNVSFNVRVSFRF